MREEGGLVTAVGGFVGQIARQQERRIGLDHQPVIRDVDNAGAQCPAAALVADPARDPNVQIQIETAMQEGLIGGKTMQHRCRQGIAVLRHNGKKIGLGVALMEKGRFAVPRRACKLRRKCLALGRTGREITKIVESGFTRGHHLGPIQQLAKAVIARAVPFTGMMGVDAGGRAGKRGVTAHKHRRGL